MPKESQSWFTKDELVQSMAEMLGMHQIYEDAKVFVEYVEELQERVQRGPEGYDQKFMEELWEKQNDLCSTVLTDAIRRVPDAIKTAHRILMESEGKGKA